MKKVFIDGSAGTTGLRIRERFAARQDITLLTLSEEQRKDADARKEMLNQADIAFLCLPDAAAMEAVALTDDPDTVIIDTSTAHRTDPAWLYGFPELCTDKDAYKTARRVANPGCHASGFLALTAPLTRAGLLPADSMLTCFSLTGYSGGGKKMIAEYEAPDADVLLSAPRMYGISQKHKHLPEMAKFAALTHDPVFCPIVAPFYAGMEVTIPLFAEQIKGTARDIRDVYRDFYKTGLVRYLDAADESGFFSAAAMTGRDDMQVTVSGNEERILLVARFDNLGKGASGAAIQNMNLILGVPEDTGLVC